MYCVEFETAVALARINWPEQFSCAHVQLCAIIPSYERVVGSNLTFGAVLDYAVRFDSFVSNWLHSLEVPVVAMVK